MTGAVIPLVTPVQLAQAMFDELREMSTGDFGAALGAFIARKKNEALLDPARDAWPPHRSSAMVFLNELPGTREFSLRAAEHLAADIKARLEGEIAKARRERRSLSAEFEALAKQIRSQLTPLGPERSPARLFNPNVLCAMPAARTCAERWGNALLNRARYFATRGKIKSRLIGAPDSLRSKDQPEKPVFVFDTPRFSPLRTDGMLEAGASGALVSKGWVDLETLGHLAKSGRLMPNDRIHYRALSGATFSQEAGLCFPLIFEQAPALYLTPEEAIALAPLPETPLAPVVSIEHFRALREQGSSSTAPPKAPCA